MRFSRGQWIAIILVTISVWVAAPVMNLFMHTDAENVTLLHTLILAALLPALLIPTRFRALTKRRLFPLGWAVWAGLIIPALFLLFRYSAGLSDRCDRVFVACGIFAFVSICGLWMLGQFKELQSEAAQLPCAQGGSAHEVRSTGCMAERSAAM